MRKEVLESGDEIHYPERFDKIGVLYEMRILGKVAVVDSTAMRRGKKRHNQRQTFKNGSHDAFQ